MSLLCTPSKILERLVPFLPLSSDRNGFRALHSTTTLLTSLMQRTLEGLKHSLPALRSLVAGIDISKAFDTVKRHVLISEILRTDMPPNYKKWLANFL